MAASEMYDFLSTVTPDVDVTLSLTPQGQIRESGTKNQIVHVADDNSREVVSLSDDSIFYLYVPYNALSEADAGTIFDMYHDAAKANGRENSIKFQHPTDGHTYVVKFDCDLDRVKQLAAIWGFAEIRFWVKGRVAD